MTLRTVLDSYTNCTNTIFSKNFAYITTSNNLYKACQASSAAQLKPKTARSAFHFTSIHTHTLLAFVLAHEARNEYTKKNDSVDFMLFSKYYMDATRSFSGLEYKKKPIQLRVS